MICRIPTARLSETAKLAHPEDEDKPYFLGTVLLTKDQRNASEILARYAIVDGQQRLTTVCMFVAACREQLQQQSDPELQELPDYAYEGFFRRSNQRKFHTVEYDDLFFEQRILGAVGVGPGDTQSPKRLDEAMQFFRTTLISIPNDIAKLLKKLLASQVLVYAVETPLAANSDFRTLK